MANETIVAIATPLGVAGIGVIRLSGPESIAILQRLMPIKELKPRYVHFGTVIDPTTQVAVDEACAIYFKAPHSYTGEDVVEIQCHSSPLILKTIVGLAVAQGAEPARAGEFTRRAFVNGKMDLTKAESVIDLIHAQSEPGRRVALSHLKGRLFELISHSRQTLMHCLEHVEASIDFPAEVEPVNKAELRSAILILQTKLKTILDKQDYGKWIQSGVNCLIVGYPNVGKSSLLNCLLGENRAIVSAQPGTTRDFIDATIEIGGLLFKIIDTAGFRKAKDKIEATGIRKITGLLEEAHAVFWVLDAGRELNDEEIKLYAKLKNHPKLFLLINKSDLKTQKLDLAALPGAKDRPALKISAKQKKGLDELKTHLYEEFVSKTDGLDADLICNVRQIDAIKSVYQTLTHLLDSLAEGFEDDMLALDLKQAILKLGELTGQEVTEEVLDGIFHRFCIGK